METLRNRQTGMMIIGTLAVCLQNGCMMMGHDSMRDRTQASAGTTKVIKESVDHDLTLSTEFSSAKVNESVRYVARLTETANAKPVSGARIRLYAVLASSGKEIYSCPMHPEVVADKPGTCPKCGMELKKQQRPQKRVELTAVSHENDSWIMEEISTTGVYSTSHTYSLEGSYTISISLLSIGDRTIDPPIVLTSTQEILADHGSHTGGLGMNTTTIIALGAVAMALMMAFSWGRWF